MPPMTATPNMQDARPAVDAARPAAKVRQKPVVRFPYQIHSAITPAMNRAIERLSAGNSLLASADIVRMALHGYLLANDPHYHRELGGSRA
jgi:hypothetical protein